MKKTAPVTNADWKVLVERAKVALANGREIDGGIDPNDATPSPYQPRDSFNQESLSRLGLSLKNVGQIYPGIIREVSGRKTKYEILDGERRWRSAQMIKLRYRATLVDIDDEAAAFLIAAIANLNRESHTPIEISDSIIGMLQLGMPMEEVADMLGISMFWASQLHGLKNLHSDVRAMLDPAIPKNKQLGVTAAVQISKADKSVQLQLARNVLSRKITLKGLRNEVVRASHRAGTHIREREPRRSWDSVKALAGQVARISQDLIEMSNQQSFSVMIQTRSDTEIHDVTNKLDATSDRLALLSTVLQGKKKLRMLK